MAVEEVVDARVAALASWLSAHAGLDFSGARGRWLRDFTSSLHPVDDTWLRRLLAGDREVVDQLCNAATVQESYFFREPSMLDFLRKQVIPELAARPGRIRVWSAGCAGGEEAYTVAMLLTDAGVGQRSAVLGTDLAEAAVRHAARGVFGPWSMRGTRGDREAATRFRRLGKEFAVAPEAHAPVEFAQHNLLDEAPPSPADFDLVLCRNVLIYLTPGGVQHAARLLTRALRPGGWLLTGVSDPQLEGVDGLEQISTPGGPAYRRVAAGENRTPSPREAASRERARPAARPRTSTPRRLTGARPRDGGPHVPIRTGSPLPARTWVEEAERALHMGRPQEAERLARAALRDSDGRQTASSVLVRALEADGRLSDALEAARLGVEEFPSDAELRGLHAAALMQAGQLDEARAAARRAIYLEPGTPLGHLVLARSAELLGDEQAARKARRNAQRLLAGGSP